jgi:biotin transport system substrate-specific component
MNEALLLRAPMNSILLRSTNRSIFNQAAVVLLASILLAISAKIAVVLQPVPITLQTFAVLCIAMICGWRIGVASVALYLLEGATGLPVFAPDVPGIAALFGPTGGYLVGFLPAAMITGLLISKGWGQHRVTTFLAAILGMAVIYLSGLSWLTHFVGVNAAINLGLKPFMFVDAMKVVVLTIAVPLFWRPTEVK